VQFGLQQDVKGLQVAPPAGPQPGGMAGGFGGGLGGPVANRGLAAPQAGPADRPMDLGPAPGGGLGGFGRNGANAAGGRARGGMRPALERMPGLQAATPPPPPPLVVREFAHVRPTTSPADVRSDFIDTVYWHPALVLPGGKAEASFDLCDSVTTYQVT